MASSANLEPRLEQFTVASVEGLDEGKERGRGCYGAVYEVRLHGLPCIAKRLHDILVGRGKEEPVPEEQRIAMIGRFREECVLLSGLRHPNVVQFMGVHYGRDEADISLIMEYMHMDLDQCMKTYPDILLPYKTSILRDVVYGLAYLHSIPIIHRDLNAGNVLLTESLRAKIADLGVAKLFDRETAMIHTRTLCPGAQDFMPPECLDESPKYNTKVDIFSFGHLTIYLANQKAPVVTDRSVTSADLQSKQMQVGKRRGSLTKMGGPGHPLYSIAVQCLSDTPDQRPTSRDLVRRMEEICKKQPPRYKNTLTELTAKDRETRANTNAAELKAQLDVHGRRVEELKNELAASRAQNAQLKRAASNYQMESTRADRLQNELEHVTAQNRELEETNAQLKSSNQVLSTRLQNKPSSQLDHTQQHLPSGADIRLQNELEHMTTKYKELERFNIQLKSSNQVLLARLQTNKPQAQLDHAPQPGQQHLAYFANIRLQNELEHMTAQYKELERFNIQLKSSNQVLSARLQHKPQYHHSPRLNHTPLSGQHHVPPGAVNVRPTSEHKRWQQPNPRQVYQEQLYRQQQQEQRRQQPGAIVLAYSHEESGGRSRSSQQQQFPVLPRFYQPL